MDDSLVLIKQGAEAKLYSGYFHGKPCIVKERFVKTYRHPQLDQEISKERLKNEVRSLVRCRFAGKIFSSCFHIYFILFRIYCLLKVYMPQLCTVSTII